MHVRHTSATSQAQLIEDEQLTHPIPLLELHEKLTSQHPAAFIPPVFNPHTEQILSVSHKVQVSAAGQIIQVEVDSFQVYSTGQQPEAVLGSKA